MIVLALAPAVAAATGDPTDAQYASSLTQLSQGTGGGPGGGGSADAPGGLPFTGLDVGLLAAVAGGLLLAGLLLRRQRPSQGSEG